MRKRSLMLGLMMFVAVALCANAYAEGEGASWEGFWNSVGGFVHNSMPWNWGKTE